MQTDENNKKQEGAHHVLPILSIEIFQDCHDEEEGTEQNNGDRSKILDYVHEGYKKGSVDGW